MNTDFGKEVKKKLIDMGRRQSWLIEEVNNRTGMKLDNSYFQKIMRGDRNSKRVTSAICEILDIKKELLMIQSKNELFDIIESLCYENDVSIAELCRETGLRPGLFSDLKSKENATLSMDRLSVIADYFDVSTDVFFTKERIGEDQENKQYRIIDSLCKDRGVSFYRMSEESGITRSIMSELKSGRTKSLTSESIIKLAKYFDVSADVILGIDRHEPEQVAVKDHGLDEALSKARELASLLERAERIINQMGGIYDRH